MQRWFFVLACAAAAHAQTWDVVRPRPVTRRPNPRVERLLRTQVRYLLSVLPEGVAHEKEHAIRPLTSTAMSAAVCLRFMDCEAPAQTRAVVLRVVRDVARTHVRNGGATASGKPWGHQWQSAMWAYQATLAAWLLWDEVPAEVRATVLNMAIDEADRFLDLPAPYAEFLDTKAEENAWDAGILVLLSQILPRHPHAAGWRDRGLEYMLSSFAPRSAGLRGANVHDDFTLENHGFVHPDYMWTVSLKLEFGLIYRLLGKDVPPEVTVHAPEVYANLKRLTLPDGGFLYPNGTDWSYYRVDLGWLIGVLMERLAQDRQAGALAEVALATMEKMQARHGRLFAPGEFETYAGAEQMSGWLLATGLMASQLWDARADAKPLPAVWRELEGGRIFPDGRFLLMRTPRGVSTFAWGTRTQGQTIPFTPDRVLVPVNFSYVGVAGDLEARATQAISVQAAVPGSDEGAYYVTVRARQGGAAHQFSFTALPTGKSVYTERWSASNAHGGMLLVSQEPEWVYGTKARRIEQGESWLNVDGRLGFAVAGGGGIRVNGQLVVLNEAPRPDAIATVVTLPGATAQETGRFASGGFRLKVDNPEFAATLVDGYLVVTNFSADPGSVAAAGRSTSVWGHQTRVLRVE